MTDSFGYDFHYNPDKYGLKEIYEVDWSDGCYQFDLTTVWEHEGRLYWSEDSGCSCPSPYEGVRGIADLTPLDDYDAFRIHIEARAAEPYTYGGGTDQKQSILKAVREWRAEHR